MTKRDLADQINELVCDYETFGYRADHDASYEAIMYILAKLDDDEIFAKAQEIMSGNDADEIYTKIKGLLNAAPHGGM